VLKKAVWKGGLTGKLTWGKGKQHKKALKKAHWRKEEPETWCRRFAFVLEEDAAQGGASIAQLIAQAKAPTSGEDKWRLDPDDVDALFPGGVPCSPLIPFRRGAGLLEETLPALLERIAAGLRRTAAAA
jgi:hypothetical protein